MKHLADNVLELRIGTGLIYSCNWSSKYACLFNRSNGNITSFLCIHEKLPVKLLCLLYMPSNIIEPKESVREGSDSTVLCGLFNGVL
jgi:hypothetical protein